MKYTTDIFLRNKVGIPVEENPKTIEYMNSTMTVRGEPVIVREGIKYYWWRPDTICDIKVKDMTRELCKRPCINKPIINAKLEGLSYKEMLQKEGLLQYGQSKKQQY